MRLITSWPSRREAIAGDLLRQPVMTGPLTPRTLVGLRPHLIQDLLNVEGCRFLPLRELFEGHEELSHDGLRWNHDPEFVAVPTGIHLGIWRHFERVLAEVNNQGHGTRFSNFGPPGILRRKADFPIAVAKRVEAAGIVEVENLLPLARSFAGENVGHVIRVEMNLERPVNALIPSEKLLLHIRHTSCCEESRCPILVRGDVVDDGVGLDDAGPASYARDAEASVPSGALFSAERLGTTIRPCKLFGTVVRGQNNDGVVGDAQVIELLEKLADDPIEFHHAVCVQTITALVFPLRAQTSPDMHACGVVPEKKWLPAFHGFIHEIERNL